MNRIAIIDLGSYSLRLLVVDVLDSGNFMISDELKEAVRLGQDMSQDGFLKKARVDHTIKTLKMFKTLCDANGVEEIYAFATSAVRQAKNQKSFLDMVTSTCHINMRVLTQEEEVRFIYQGVINSMDVPKGLIMDIGGSCTQLIHYNRRNLLHWATIPYGSVVLTEMFADLGYGPEERANKAEEFFAEELRKLDWLSELEEDVQLVGVGGSFRNLGKICRKMKKYNLEMAHNYPVSVTRFHGVYDTIKTLDLDKTMRIKGLSTARADIFPSALAAINATIERCHFDHIIISGAGLREGVMFSHAVPITNEKPITDVLGHSIYGMLRFCDCNITHAEHVYNLSMQLFKHLKVLHKLPRAYVRVLRTASLLHDVGCRLKYYDHHKHSCYFILNSNLYGISQHDLVMAAFVAAAHREGDPFIGDFVKYKDMFSEEDLDAMAKLGVILKIAESFDRTQSGLITGISCDVLGDSVIMKTFSEGDVTLEIKDAMNCLVQFKRAFKKNLEIL